MHSIFLHRPPVSCLTLTLPSSSSFQPTRFMGNGLLTVLDYATWKPRRKLYNPSFKRRCSILKETGQCTCNDTSFFTCTYSSLKELLPNFNESVNTFLDGLRPLADGKTQVPMKEAFHDLTLSVISKVRGLGGVLRCW